jgi:hypothetical protein
MENFKVQPTKLESATFAAYEIIGSYFKSCTFKNKTFESRCTLNFRLENLKTQYYLEDKFIKFCEKRKFEEKFKDTNCVLSLEKYDEYFKLHFLNKTENFTITIFKDTNFKCQK